MLMHTAFWLCPRRTGLRVTTSRIARAAALLPLLPFNGPKTLLMEASISLPGSQGRGDTGKTFCFHRILCLRCMIAAHFYRKLAGSGRAGGRLRRALGRNFALLAMLIGALGSTVLRPRTLTACRSSSAFFVSTGVSSIRRWQSAVPGRAYPPRPTQAKAVAVPAAAETDNTVVSRLPSTLADIYALSEQELCGFLQDTLHQPKYRAKQVHAWLYQRGAASFEEMSDLPKSLRLGLAEHFKLGCLEVAFEQVSKDGTVKRAYRLADGQLIEAVLMPYEDGRRTACISSQAGCAMGCVFCQTGQMGFARQLTESEIFEQALLFSRDLTKGGERLSNVVFMGEGEPLNNRRQVFGAVRRLNADLGIGARHITVSTVGLAPRIRDLADAVDDPEGEGALLSQIKVAVSLHATRDAERTAIMPVNRRFPIAELMAACQYYVQRTNRRLSFEWALISGQNDSPQVANELGRLLSPLKGKCHVNVINVNPTTGFEGQPGSKAAMDRFLNILNEDWGIPATMRVRRGLDINAGCGQLKNELLGRELSTKGLAATPPRSPEASSE